MINLYVLFLKYYIFSDQSVLAAVAAVVAFCLLVWLGDNFDVELNMGYLGVSALLPHKSSPLQSY